MTTQPKAWLDLTKEERTAYLLPLLDQRVKFALNSEVDAGRMAFGSAYPTPWQYGKLQKLLAVDDKAHVLIAIEFEVFGMKLPVPGSFDCDTIYALEAEAN